MGSSMSQDISFHHTTDCLVDFKIDTVPSSASLTHFGVLQTISCPTCYHALSHRCIISPLITFFILPLSSTSLTSSHLPPVRPSLIRHQPIHTPTVCQIYKMLLLVVICPTFLQAFILSHLFLLAMLFPYLLPATRNWCPRKYLKHRCSKDLDLHQRNLLNH